MLMYFWDFIVMMMSKCRNESEKMTDADWHKYNFEIWLFSCRNVKENLSSVFSKSSLCISDLPCEQVDMYVIYQKVYICTIIPTTTTTVVAQPRKQKNCQLIDDGYHDEIKSQSEADWIGRPQGLQCLAAISATMSSTSDPGICPLSRHPGIKVSRYCLWPIKPINGQKIY